MDDAMSRLLDLANTADDDRLGFDPKSFDPKTFDPKSFDPERMVDAVLSDCAGDSRAAVLALVRINTYLVRENRRLSSAASSGFTRGHRA